MDPYRSAGHVVIGFFRTFANHEADSKGKDSKRYCQDGNGEV